MFYVCGVLSHFEGGGSARCFLGKTRDSVDCCVNGDFDGNGDSGISCNSVEYSDSGPLGDSDKSFNSFNRHFILVKKSVSFQKV